MTGLFEGVALRGAGLLTQAGAVAVQPRPRSRFEPEGFVMEQREIQAAPAVSETEVTTTQVRTADPATRVPSAGSEADATRQMKQAPAETRDSRATPPPPQVAAEPVGEASRSSAPPPPVQPRDETKGQYHRAMPDDAASPVQAIADADTPSPRRDVSGQDSDGSKRGRQRPDPEEPTFNNALRQAIEEPPAPAVSVRIATGDDGRERLADAAPRRPAAEPMARSGKQQASIEPARPLVSVSIGRIEVEIEPRPSPQPVPSRPPVPRTRGFEGYGRARHGQPR